ncbi:DUF4129 domain-containing protein [Halobacteriaceae archaeon GCM10025711]
MKASTLLTAVVAIGCLIAVGTAASSLDDAVGTDPDDIDVDYASLPVAAEDVADLKQQAESQGHQAATAGGKDESSASVSQPDQSNSQSASEEQSESQAGGGADQSSASSSQSESDQGTAPAEQSLVDRLLSLLETLLAWLLGAGLLLGLLAVVALAVRYRDRIRAWLLARAERYGLLPDDADRSTVPPPDPSNEVAAAWYEFVSRLGLDRDRAKTTGECARRAVDAGVDAETVEMVRRPFEEVRYGGAPVTDDRRERAHHGVQRFRAEYRDGGDR